RDLRLALFNQLSDIRDPDSVSLRDIIVIAFVFEEEGDYSEVQEIGLMDSRDAFHYFSAHAQKLRGKSRMLPGGALSVIFSPYHHSAAFFFRPFGEILVDDIEHEFAYGRHVAPERQYPVACR